jgi:hypothetical protein
MKLDIRTLAPHDFAEGDRNLMCGALVVGAIEVSNFKPALHQATGLTDCGLYCVMKQKWVNPGLDYVASNSDAVAWRDGLILGDGT